MIVALLLAAAAPQTAVDAERAFADMAHKQGQWTAFHAFAAPDALMFVPDATNAQAWLSGRKEPAASVHWWPARSWVSCDGSLAVNFGPALYGTNGYGTFTTVWQRRPDGSWKWLLDQGSPTPRAFAAEEGAKTIRPGCRSTPGKEAALAHLSDEFAVSRRHPDFLFKAEGHMPARTEPQTDVHGSGVPLAGGASADGTLSWMVHPLAGKPGARRFNLFIWDGSKHRSAMTELSGVEIK